MSLTLIKTALTAAAFVVLVASGENPDAVDDVLVTVIKSLVKK